jgi:transcriptional regulator with XRE-family HTH domain
LEKFPSRLRRLRDRDRLKRYQLSELCGLSPDMVRKYERGEASPGVDALTAIADYFEVSTDFLLGRTDYPNVLEPKKRHRL